MESVLEVFRDRAVDGKFPHLSDEELERHATELLKEDDASLCDILYEVVCIINDSDKRNLCVTILVIVRVMSFIVNDAARLTLDRCLRENNKDLIKVLQTLNMTPEPDCAIYSTSNIKRVLTMGDIAEVEKMIDDYPYTKIIIGNHYYTCRDVGTLSVVFKMEGVVFITITEDIIGRVMLESSRHVLFAILRAGLVTDRAMEEGIRIAKMLGSKDVEEMLIHARTAVAK